MCVFSRLTRFDWMHSSETNESEPISDYRSYSWRLDRVIAEER